MIDLRLYVTLVEYLSIEQATYPLHFTVAAGTKLEHEREHDRDSNK